MAPGSQVIKVHLPKYFEIVKMVEKDRIARMIEAVTTLKCFTEDIYNISEGQMIEISLVASVRILQHREVLIEEGMKT